MILSQIIAYLADRGQASTTDISLHFGVSPDALESMLNLLEAKGRIRAQPAAMPVCGTSCCGCAIAECGPKIWIYIPRG